MERYPFQVGLREYCAEMKKKFDPTRLYCMALTERSTICLYPSAAGTSGVCGRSVEMVSRSFQGPTLGDVCHVAMQSGTRTEVLLLDGRTIPANAKCSKDLASNEMYSLDDFTLVESINTQFTVPSKSSIHQSRWHTPTGLPWFHNSCFINATLQVRYLFLVMIYCRRQLLLRPTGIINYLSTSAMLERILDIMHGDSKKRFAQFWS